jgi:hypothetical protein
MKGSVYRILNQKLSIFSIEPNPNRSTKRASLPLP